VQHQPGFRFGEDFSCFLKGKAFNDARIDSWANSFWGARYTDQFLSFGEERESIQVTAHPDAPGFAGGFYF
jgi:hypothetical protein